jgi:hypothetical protein
MREVYEILEDLLVELEDTIVDKGCVVIDSDLVGVANMIENELSEKEAYYYKIDAIAEAYISDINELVEERNWKILEYNNTKIKICK